MSAFPQLRREGHAGAAGAAAAGGPVEGTIRSHSCCTRQRASAVVLQRRRFGAALLRSSGKRQCSTAVHTAAPSSPSGASHSGPPAAACGAALAARCRGLVRSLASSPRCSPVRSSTRVRTCLRWSNTGSHLTAQRTERASWPAWPPAGGAAAPSRSGKRKMLRSRRRRARLYTSRRSLYGSMPSRCRTANGGTARRACVTQAPSAAPSVTRAAVAVLA